MLKTKDTLFAKGVSMFFVKNKSINMQRTKIVCTIGPASQSETMIEKLIKAGMDCTRLNFSHGSYLDHLKIIKNVRAAAKKTKKTVAIIQDLQGPKIRIGNLPEKGILLKKNSIINLQSGKEYLDKIIPIGYQGFDKLLKSNDIILMDDGKIKLKILKST